MFASSVCRVMLPPGAPDASHFPSRLLATACLIVAATRMRFGSSPSCSPFAHAAPSAPIKCGSSAPPSPLRPHRGSLLMLITGPQHSRPIPFPPLSIHFRLKPARVSTPTTPAIACMRSRSKVAAKLGPDGKETEHLPPWVQLLNIDEWMQLEPQ